MKYTRQTVTGILSIVLTVIGTALFCMSFTTGYYTFGQLNSGVIAALLAGALIVEIADLWLQKKLPDALWAKFLTYGVTAMLAAAAVLLIGDRVEGIGTCIITDYDSGHGGEQAIYYSLAGSVAMLAAVIYNIIGSFENPKSSGVGKAGKIGFPVSAVAVVAAIAICLSSLLGALGGGSGTGGTGSVGVYTVSYNQGNENCSEDVMPNYQFLCGALDGMVRADSRLYVDIKLELADSGSYKLFSESYVIESGKRAVVGDDTGLGMELTMNAEGTYSRNTDGTVTTFAPSHAVLVMKTDTYSAQMKGAAQMNVGGKTDDGVYDSNDEPAVLELVPETVWTLGDGTIESYRNNNIKTSVYTVSYNQANGNVGEGMPNYQFLCTNLSGLIMADSRSYVDLRLELSEDGKYTLFADSYVIESGKRAEVGDDTGLGMVLTTKATGTYTKNEDGTVITSPADHAVFEMKTDTYSSQLKDAFQLNVAGKTDDGVYDSDSEPAVLDFVPETLWTLSDGAIVSYEKTAEEPGEEETAAQELATVASDDGATTLTFYTDGTYRFFFEAYGVEDKGTYTYDGTTLTLVNGNGVEATATGDPMKLHYVTAVNDQLTGDYTIEASTLAAPAGEELAVIASDDGATTLTFYADGTYRFFFEAYNVEDKGTYTYDGTTLTLVNGNGVEATATGDPMKLHYVTAVNDQLTGDYTIEASVLAAPAGEELAVIASDDGATTLTFYTDGTYRFFFEAYGVEDKGTYTYDGTTLTLVNANGAEATATGDPMKLHYVTAVNDQLTGDYTINAADLGGTGEKAAEAKEVFQAVSDDGATTLTFYTDGTYRFFFEAYSVEDKGTYTYDGTTLTLVNANGAEATATGDPMKLHYVTAVSDQLTGDFTISAADLGGNGGDAAEAKEVFQAVSDDEATSITFFDDGTYRFFFEAYGVEDLGKWTYDGTTLTLVNANGVEATATGSPLKLHYVTAVSDQLTGDYTIQLG